MFQLTPIRTLIVGSLLTLSIASACGGDAAPEAAPTATSVATATAAPVATPTEDVVAEIAPAPVVPAVEPEAGSDEATILDGLDQVARAMRTEDWVSYLEVCNPTRSIFTLAQIEFLADNIFNTSGNMAGTNYRDVTVQIYGEDTAKTESNLYEYDTVIFENYSHSWSKVDGNWYSNSNCNPRS